MVRSVKSSLLLKLVTVMNGINKVMMMMTMMMYSACHVDASTQVITDCQLDNVSQCQLS